MSDIYVSKKDDVYIQIGCDEGILRELSEYFSFEVDGAQFSPAYKQKKWDGKIRLLNRRNNTLYFGLLYHLCEFANQEEYTVDIDESVDVPDSRPSKDETISFYEDTLDIHSGGQKISPRGPQVDGLSYALGAKRCVLEAATASGKSLIIYAIVRYLDMILPEDEKILLIVPSISLVDQMYTDFEDYSSNDEWSVSDNCHKVFQGQEKMDKGKRVVISTYQSIYDQPKKYFNVFGGVIGDEAHIFQASTLKSLMQKLTDCPYRYALTGTLQDMECHRWVIEGLFGPAYSVVSAREMINMGDAPPLDITAIILNYPEVQRKRLYDLKGMDENKNRKFHLEREFILENTHRQDFLLSMGTEIQGNTLILFELVEKQGKPLYEVLKKESGKKVYMVYGDTEGYEREEIRKIMEKESNAIIVASYGVFSTGVSIKNLHNTIFASSPGKKRKRVVQSIGRLLRKHKGKEKVQLYDIVDDLSYKDKPNFMINHFMDRVNIYINEGHEYEIITELLE